MRARGRPWSLAGAGVLLAGVAYLVGTGIARGGASGALTGFSPDRSGESAGAVIAPSAPSAPEAPPVVVAPSKPARPKSPVTASPGKAPKSPSVLAQQRRGGDSLAPPVMLGSSPQPPEAPSVVSAPNAPALPPRVPVPGPPVSAGPSAPPPIPSPPVIASAPPPPGPPAEPVTGGPFTERPSQREIPEISITNTTGYPATLTLTQGQTRLRWQIDRSLRESIEPGTYEFRLYHAIYRRTGRPDMVGTLTCRRYKAYDCEIFWRAGSNTTYGRIGDRE